MFANQTLKTSDLGSAAGKSPWAAALKWNLFYMQSGGRKMERMLSKIREEAIAGLCRGPGVHIDKSQDQMVLREHDARYRNLELRGRMSVSEYLKAGRGGAVAFAVVPLFHPPMAV